MTEPTLLQQARHHADLAKKLWPTTTSRADSVLDALECILQHLEQQQAATREPAQVPSSRRPETVEELLQQLCDRASPGPWRFDDADCEIVDADGEMVCEFPDVAAEQTEHDGAFIAAARDALPKLIELVRKVQPFADVVDRAPRCPKCHKPWLGSTRYYHQTRRCFDNAWSDGCKHTWPVDEHGNEARNG